MLSGMFTILVHFERFNVVSDRNDPVVSGSKVKFAQFEISSIAKLCKSPMLSGSSLICALFDRSSARREAMQPILLGNEMNFGQVYIVKDDRCFKQSADSDSDSNCPQCEK